MKRVFLTGMLLLVFAGCIRTIDERGGKKYTPDPNSVEAIAAVGQALSPVLPVAGTAVAALLAGWVAYTKKVKPEVDKAKSEANLNHTTASWLVGTIEELKKTNPKEWEKIKPLFKEAEWGPQVEAVIEALRNGTEARS